MGFLADLVAAPRKGDDGSLALFREIYGSQLSKTGAHVDWRKAIRVATVHACARAKSEGLAQVPLKIFQSRDGRRAPATEHPLYYLLDTEPNEWQTAFEYRETIGLHLSMAGYHYSFINRLRGEIVELIPLMPGNVTPVMNRGEITYKVTTAEGATETFPASAIWHIRGLSWNGWQGLEVMELAREAIGLTIAAEDRHASIFKNGVQSSGVYSVEGTLEKKQYQDLRAFIKENHTGVMAGMPMVLDRGAKWLQQAMSGVDMQHYEVRRLQVEEVCRAMGVLPIAIGHADKTATFASAEAFFSAHDRLTMLPLFTRVEKSINARLLGRKAVEKDGYYAKHINNGLLRASAKDRADYFAKALGAGGAPGWYTQDEVRELDEMNPFGGDAARLPVASNVPKPPTPKGEPDADDAPPSD